MLNIIHASEMREKMNAARAAATSNIAFQLLKIAIQQFDSLIDRGEYQMQITLCSEDLIDALIALKLPNSNCYLGDVYPSLQLVGKHYGYFVRSYTNDMDGESCIVGLTEK